MLVETGRVVALEETAVWVETIRSSACGSCAARSGCGHRTLAGALTQDKGLVRALETESLSAADCSVDDWVEISIPNATLSKGALLLYAAPLVFATLLALMVEPLGEGAVIGGFFVGLSVAFLSLRWSGAQAVIGVVEPLLTGRAIGVSAEAVELKILEDK
jgi:sigma-E factor negative regulatory protein RseC